MQKTDQIETAQTPGEWEAAGGAGAALVNGDRYPIDRPGDRALLHAIEQAREGLAHDGCARIGQFINPEWHTALAEETTGLAPEALFSTQSYTPYGTPADESFPETHPRRREHRTTSGNVTRDLIPETSLLQTLYQLSLIHI